MTNYYAAAGLGFGVDVSHYGAPYQGMLGINGMGQTTWSPGPGQTPSDDPRMVKKFAVVRSLYRVRNVPSDKAGRLADLLLARARVLFQGSTVRKIGTTGWTNDGRVGFEVVLAAATRAGEIKLRNATARDVAGQLGGGAELYDAQTAISATDYMPLEDTMLPPSEQPVAETSGGTQTIGGLPIWAAAGIGVAAVGAVAFLVLGRKKPVTANRRRRSSRRRSRRMKRNSQGEFKTKAEAEIVVRDLKAMYKRMGYAAPEMRVVEDKHGWTITNDLLDSMYSKPKSRKKRRVTKNARRTSSSKKKVLPPGYVQIGDGGTSFIEYWDIEENLGGFILGRDSKKNMTQFGHPQNFWAIPSKHAAAFRAKIADAIGSELRHIERIESSSRRR